VTAVTREGGAGQVWRPSAFATCGSPALMQHVQAASARTSEKFRTATVQCPPGLRVFGGGASMGLSGGNNRVMLDGVTPDRSLQSLTVSAHEDLAGTDQPWTLFAYATCAATQGDLELHSTSSPLDSERIKIQEATCSPGKKVVGVLGDIRGEHRDNAVLSTMIPSSSGVVPQTSVYVSAYEGLNSGDTSTWQLRAFAICALP
jgi:hypothetical protein